MGVLSYDESTDLVTIFSPPGAGKTTLAAKLGGPGILIAGDNGYRSLKRFPELAKSIEPRAFEDFDTIRKAIKELQKEGGHLILDSFGSMVEQMISFYMYKTKPNGAQNPYFHNIKRDHEDIPAWGDYLLAKRKWEPIIRGLSMMPNINVTITCHHKLPAPPSSDPKYVEKTYGETTRPDLNKEVLTLVYKYTSVLGYLERSDTGKRTLRIQPNKRLTAKTWIDFPSDVVDDTTFVQCVIDSRRSI